VSAVGISRDGERLICGSRALAFFILQKRFPRRVCAPPGRGPLRAQFRTFFLSATLTGTDLAAVLSLADVCYMSGCKHGWLFSLGIPHRYYFQILESRSPFWIKSLNYLFRFLQNSCCCFVVRILWWCFHPPSLPWVLQISKISASYEWVWEIQRVWPILPKDRVVRRRLCYVYLSVHTYATAACIVRGPRLTCSFMVIMKVSGWVRRGEQGSDS